jgi:hypothetical protein
MEIDGLNNLNETLESASSNFNEEATKALDKISNRLIKNVKLKTPVDTGVLRRNWQLKKINDFEREIINSTKYAQFIEYGHRTRGGKSFIEGTYMLNKSVSEIESDLDEAFSIMIDNLFRD